MDNANNTNTDTINHTSFRSTRAVDWRKVDHKIYGGIVTATGTNLFGETYSIEIAFRLDGRDGGYRVDMCSMTSMPWEAIDNGVPVRTLAEGKALVRAWLRGSSRPVAMLRAA